MPIHYDGDGALLDDAGQKVDEVDYTFDLDTERGLTGYLRSPSPYLSKQTTTCLRLGDGRRFVAVRLGVSFFHWER